MKVAKFTCERCDVVKEVPPDTVLPKTWETIRGKQICDRCVNDLDSFLRGARIEHIAVDRSSEEQTA